MLVRTSLFVVLCSIFFSGQRQTRAAETSRPFFEQDVLAPVSQTHVWNCLPSIARLGNGDLMAAWSIGDRAWATDLQVFASLSHDGGRTWSPAKFVAGEANTLNCDVSLTVDGKTVLLTWSHVRNTKRLDKIETRKIVSTDFGRTWTKPVVIPTGRKYAGTLSRSSLVLRDGTLVLPFGWDLWVEQGMIPKTEGESDSMASLLTSRDHGHSWQVGGAVHVDAPKISPFSSGGACEPGIVELADGSLYMAVRTGTSHAWESRSRDQGKTWDKPKPSPLQAHNTNVTLRRLNGSDEVIAVWNDSPRYRWPLVTAISADGCRTFSTPRALAVGPGLEASYASVTQLDDGTLVVVWQQDLPKNTTREIRIARFNRSWVLADKRPAKTK